MSSRHPSKAPIPMCDFSSTISEIDRGVTDAEAVRSVRRQLEDTLARLEGDVAAQERRRVENVNQLQFGQAQVAELSDRVAKARKREELLAEKVTGWVRYLQEEKKKMLIKENRLCAGVSDELDGSVEYHINMITEKRTEVDECVAETRERRQQHKNYLRMLKAELDELQKTIVDWDQKVKEMDVINSTLLIRREQLEEQLANKERMEQTEKTKCQELEREMARLARGSFGPHQHSLTSFSNLNVSNSEAGSTTLAEGLLSDIRRLHKSIIP